MTTPAPDRAADHPRDEWRAELITRLGWTLFVGAAVIATYIGASPSLGWIRFGALAFMLATAGATAVATRVDFRVRGLLLVLSLLALGSASARFSGPSPAMFLGFALGTVIAAVVFGGRLGLLTLLVSAGCLFAFGVAGRLETTPVWVAQLPRQAAWGRMAAIYAVATGLLVLLVSGSVRRVERSLAEARASLAEASRARQARDRAEEALGQNEQRLGLALEAARMATWEWNIATGAVSWTGPVEALVGLRTGNGRGGLADIRETVHPDDLPALERTLGEMLVSDGSEYETEYRVRGANPVRWVEGKGRVYRDAQGRPVLMRGTAADVTARKRTEEALRRAGGALRESEERWRRISEATSEGIAFSENGVITDVNLQLASMLGYAPAELIGMPVQACVAPADRAQVVEAIRAGHLGAYEHQALRKDGSVFPVEVRARTLTVGARPVRVSAIRDLSERSRLEAELRRRETLAAMGSLVAAVAHEVRTPLASLSATIDTLETRNWTPVQREELRGLLRSQVWRLSNLMQDLLDYGRPPRLKLARGWLEPVLQATLESCQPLGRHTGVRIALDVQGAAPDVPADPERARQVLENLVANAIQHSPIGGTVTLSVRAGGGPMGFGLLLQVEDRGRGVAPADLERIFEPFFSRRRGGTGMGLAVARRLVEAHGGSLTAANRMDGGAVFTVSLPPRPDEESGPPGRTDP